MLRWICFWIVLLWSIVCSASEDHTQMRQYVYPVVTAVTSLRTGSIPREIATSSGSAVLIKPNYLLTAAHLIPTNPSIKMYIKINGALIKTTPIKIDRRLDLALIYAKAPCPCSPVRDIAMPPIDAVVYSVGYPLYLQYQMQLMSTGSIQGYFKGKLVTTAPSAPGGSGGGIYSYVDGKYELVGINVAIATDDDSISKLLVQEHNWISFGIPLPVIRRFIK